MTVRFKTRPPHPSSSRQDVLKYLIHDQNWKIGAELGVFRGQTLVSLLSAFDDLTMIGVDLWPPTEMMPVTPRNKVTGEASYYGEPMDLHERAVRRSVERFGTRCKLFKMATVEAADHIADRSLDFVFIDADHRTQSVLDDIAAWSRKVRLDGFLLGHDIDWPSVRTAVSQAFEGRSWFEMPANVWGIKVTPQ